MSLDSMSDSDQTGSGRPIEGRDTQNKLKLAKKRKWVAEPGKIRNGMQEQIEKLFNRGQE